MAYGIVVLILSDSAATIVGKKFRIAPLPYNRHKSVGGFLGFFVVSFVAGYLILGTPTVAIVLSLVLAFIESINVRIDDNVLLPVAVILLQLI